MLRTLDRRYGGRARLADRGRSDPMESLVRTILSQNTTNRNRDRGYDGLMAAFGSWEQVAKASHDAVAEAVRPAGLAEQKATAILGLMDWLGKRGEATLDFVGGMAEEEALAALLEIRGVGLKTAAVVLGYAFEMDVCAVDTHVHRVANRTGLVATGHDRDRTFYDLAPLIPRGRACAFHVDLIAFGRDICTARTPDCPGCPFRTWCPSADLDD